MERFTVLQVDPTFIGPETLTEFARGLRSVADVRTSLMESVAAKAAEAVALEKQIAGAASYIDLLRGSFNVCPVPLASTDFRVMQMNVMDECEKNARDLQRDLGLRLEAVRRDLDQLTSDLFDMNEAVHLAKVPPRAPAHKGFDDALRALDGLRGRCPELDRVRAELEGVRDEVEAENGRHNCPVCWERQATHMCAPCGHMYCERCVGTLSVCAACRVPVAQKIKAFYSF